MVVLSRTWVPFVASNIKRNNNVPVKPMHLRVLKTITWSRMSPSVLKFRVSELLANEQTLQSFHSRNYPHEQEI